MKPKAIIVVLVAMVACTLIASDSTVNAAFPSNESDAQVQIQVEQQQPGSQPRGSQTGPLSPVGSGFNFQGQLKDGGNPANGQYDLIFTLYDAETAGNQVGSPIPRLGQTIADGLIAQTLDFGAGTFQGQARWLGIEVRQSGGGSYTTLSPRQPLTAVPYAMSLATGSGGAVISTTLPGAALSITNTNNTGMHAFGNGVGVYGISPGGPGVVGRSTSTTGVSGYSNTNIGVFGQGVEGLHGFGSVTGVYGVSSSGNGVYGVSSSSYGVYGSSTNNSAIYGTSTNVIGVQGIAGSSVYPGVRGENTGSGPGVEGWSTNGNGVFGRSSGNTGYGVYGANTSGNGWGVFGVNNSNDPDARGVVGSSGSGFGVTGLSTSGRGVVGTSNTGFGVFGSTSNTNGAASGVKGEANVTNGLGVAGSSSGSNGKGVFGYSNNGSGIAVMGQNDAANGWGMFGVADYDGGRGVVGRGSGNNSIGVYGIRGNGGGTRYAVFAEGDLGVTGSCTGCFGPNRIDHPVEPENKYLTHVPVQSQEMMNVYNGNVTSDAKGEAVVTLPDWFEALNRDFRYQLTIMGDEFSQARVSSKIKGNRFTIKTDKPNIEVSWQVTGVRNDPFAQAHPIEVEVLKPKDEQGKYLHPIEYGQPESKGLGYEERQRIEKASAKPQVPKP